MYGVKLQGRERLGGDKADRTAIKMDGSVPDYSFGIIRGIPEAPVEGSKKHPPRSRRPKRPEDHKALQSSLVQIARSLLLKRCARFVDSAFAISKHAFFLRNHTSSRIITLKSPESQRHYPKVTSRLFPKSIEAGKERAKVVKHIGLA